MSIWSEFGQVLARAREKHPSPTGRLAALREELEEVEEAHRVHGARSRRFREECLDVMVVAYRLIEDAERVPHADDALFWGARERCDEEC